MANPKVDIHQVAREFTQFYYNTFDGPRQDLASLYRAESTLTFESQEINGRDGILEKLISLPFTRVAHQVATLDAQRSTLNAQLPNEDTGILVMVTGALLVDEEQRTMNYSQVFQLLPNGEGSYFVLNDVFRLVFA
ncbi:MAG: nuclear transport factor 2 [Lasallia pustulata]|uniref:NTF2-related export protein n=1 Tax=Lasallia pustulata TaxID=136370 RepID=A0A5M8Q2C0_9LECA|nr:MAG: nuclear transport factor 2 [Lasallia pustulata]KAA6416268.1 MAG: nuclear transport factor 2 [Lasallia pustulata]